jgi:FtsP/CotA-like multicopper oxidase with cupredoxin domain
MSIRRFVLALTLLSSGGPLSSPGRLERILANENRASAGTLEGNVLTLHLEVRRGLWYPQSDSGLGEPVLAFAEAGHAPQIPGPLVRVPAGTMVRVSMHNAAETPLVIHGLLSRPAAGDDSIVLQAGETRGAEFTAATPGTFFYWGSAPGAGLEDRGPMESQLSGAIVVDSAGAGAGGRAADRVFVLGVWSVPVDSTGAKPWVPRDVMVINGKMWPYTERFSYAVGDSAHWRWINPSADAHPMHLHGFFYSVESRGDGVADTIYAPGDRRLVVTELMRPGGTMTMSWMAARPGNWLFHCHFAFHVSHYLSLDKITDPVDPGAADAVDHSVHGMAGLILGLTVKPALGTAVSSQSAATATRNLRVVVRPIEKTSLREERYAFVVKGTGVSDSLDPTLVLRRNEPVRITVVNELRAPTSLHWHGIEVQESYVDGVPGWSGAGEHLAPLVQPRDSFTVEFTPSRRGTYMYHSHSNEEHQISSGLYAPILVVDETKPYDPRQERVYTFGGEENELRINRKKLPDTTSMTAGTTYRIRLININPDRRMVFSLESPKGRMFWRALAVDGADLPSNQMTKESAMVEMGPGMTADFEFTPTSIDPLWLSAVSPVSSTPSIRAPIVVQR